MTRIKDYLDAKAYLEFHCENGANRDVVRYIGKMIKFTDQCINEHKISDGVSAFLMIGDVEDTDLNDTVYISSGLNLGNNFTRSHLIEAIIEDNEAENIIEAIGLTRGSSIVLEAPIKFNYHYIEEHCGQELYDELLHKHEERKND